VASAAARLPRTELAAAVTLASGAPPRVAAAAGLRIVSPRDGDVYRVPPGTDPRYATIALRAAGTGPGEQVRWLVDGRPVPEERWPLVPGRHVVTAVPRSGEPVTATFEVW
jgi:membrane carboxypeptidase/penicillin-binding protein PbpC